MNVTSVGYIVPIIKCDDKNVNDIFFNKENTLAFSQNISTDMFGFDSLNLLISFSDKLSEYEIEVSDHFSYYWVQYVESLGNPIFNLTLKEFLERTN